jgi:hypothetical protein
MAWKAEQSSDKANDAVYGVLMDIGARNGIATVVSLADGTTSLYTSTGGGIIGGGGHDKVAMATRVLVLEAERCRSLLKPDWEDGGLADGEVRLIALTPTGRLAARAWADELAAGSHALSPLFVAANNVVTRLREMSAARSAPPPSR